jgi:uncharacterized repeat protein (TIGR01451 family)
LYFVQKELPAGYTLKLEIQCQCIKAAPQAIAYVTATSAEGVPAEASTATEIVEAAPPPGRSPGTAPGPAPGTVPGTIPGTAPPPAESKLSLTVRGLANPVRVGRQFVYLITVANNGSEDEQNVVVEAKVPDGLTVDTTGTKGPMPNRLDGQIVRFDPLPVLSPGKSEIYLISVQTKAAGKMAFKAGVSSQKLSQPIIQEEDTEVTPKS